MNYSAQEYAVVKSSETLLIAGCCCTVLAAGLCQFVMIGLIGLVLFPIAFGLLLSAGILTRAAATVPWQRSAGLGVYLLGVLMLLVFAGNTNARAFDGFRSTTALTALDWQQIALPSLATAVLLF
jgi:hypothetical protein